jgi:hydrogenase maturation protein HypF
MALYRFHVTGLVQGVGFRPYVYTASTKRGLKGYVMNVGDGVVIVADDQETVHDMLAGAPKSARIDTVSVSEVDDECVGFEIRSSSGTGIAEIPSDTTLCDACLAELNDPTNRRYGYYFISCTVCGPRYTMTNTTPYDRHTTTMADFPMCSSCEKEYNDPTNRRYHAQTIACHDCGPVLKLFHNQELKQEGTGTDIIESLAKLLTEGNIVAVKGAGGYHLLCTTSPKTVRALKSYTGRTDKPFAVMCKDVEMARTLALVTQEEEVLLTSPERPIVILQKKKGLPEVTELDSVGILLPSTPLHHLLCMFIDEPVILTSSNRAGEPITKERDQQFVPWVLEHTRSITHTADDSLVKVIDRQPLYIRRSRGYVPRSVPTDSTSSACILGLGAEMNSTFALYHNGTITPSQYLGNTGHVPVLENYEHTLSLFLDYTKTHPTHVCTDLHPGYATSELGAAIAHKLGAVHVQVQHHRAHAYSIALEHKLSDFTAIICDGTGYGDDGTIWGGEVFHNNKRVGHLEQHPLLGGDVATRHPIRMTYAILRNSMSPKETVRCLGPHFSADEYALLETQWKTGLYSPRTSSCGRVLDAAAALLGICTERTYDGRPALLLESAGTEPYTCPPVHKDGVLYTTPLFDFLVANRTKDHGRLAATVHRYLAEGLFEIAQQHNTPVLFGGGCAYNRHMTAWLRAHGVLVNTNIPSGDGGISVGQIAYTLANPRNDIA